MKYRHEAPMWPQRSVPARVPQATAGAKFR